MTTFKSFGQLPIQDFPVSLPRTGPKLYIPCARCGKSLDYDTAVTFVSDDLSGYVHAVCDPTDVAEYKRRSLNAGTWA